MQQHLELGRVPECTLLYTEVLSYFHDLVTSVTNIANSNIEQDTSAVATPSVNRTSTSIFWQMKECQA